MFHFVVVGQGPLAHDLVQSVEKIQGEPQPQLHAVCLPWEGSLEDAKEAVSAALRALPDVDGVMLLTDLYGATPHNACATLVEPGKVELVSGVNLAMLLRLTTQHLPDDLRELARWICTKGASAIRRSPCEQRPVGKEGSRA